MADRFPVPHPTFDPGLDEGQAEALERAVERVMAMGEDEALAMVPVQTAIRFCGCPNCEGGMQESNQMTWTIDKPDVVTCRFCEHEYPSDTYPMDRTETVTNPLGEQVTVRYHLDAAGNDYYFEGATWRFQKGWLVGQAYALAKAYHVTKKPEYARRAALIIDRFAQLYPGLCVVEQWPFRRRKYTSRTEPPYPSAGGKWGRWMSDEIPQTLPLAYDLIYESPELDKLSEELGADVRLRIENDFFRPTVEYTLTFNNHLHNMAPFYVCGLIRIGRCIGEPEYVHWAYRWVRQMLHDRFFFDGMWCEAPSYHYQTIGGIRRVLDELEGYSDPADYTGSEAEPRLDDLQVKTAFPFIDKVTKAPDLIAYPNGKICPVHDSWAKSKTSAAREKSACQVLPGYGHAVLGAGTGEQQTAAHLHFSGGYGHQHRDNLNLSLFAFGREMISDIGYTHTKLRYWSVSTIGHNLVAIDRQDQAGSKSDGDLLMYVPTLPGLAVVEASGERAYPDLAEVYRRMAVLVSIDEAHPYVIDIFHVRGGATHDWLMHGSADDDQIATCSLDLEPRPGTLLEAGEDWVEPRGESSSFIPYGVMKNVRVGRSTEGFSATFAYGDKPELGTRIHMLGGDETEVFLAETPSIRRAGSDDREVYDHAMPQLVARRRGEAPLETVFVAVLEPLNGPPAITSAERLATSPADAPAIALRVKMGDRTDTALISLSGETGVRLAGENGLELKGRIGLVSAVGGDVTGYLVAGERLAAGEFAVTADAATFEGEIDGATRKADGAPSDAFSTTADLPVGTALSGAWMIVTHGNGYTHGYGIDRVEKRNAKTWIHLLDDHGLRIEGDTTEECYFPRREIAGRSRFIIHNASVARGKQ